MEADPYGTRVVTPNGVLNLPVVSFVEPSKDERSAWASPVEAANVQRLKVQRRSTCRPVEA